MQGFAWETATDSIQFHLSVNDSKKHTKVETGKELAVLDLDQLEETVIARRVVVSEVYTIYNPIGLMTLRTVRYK